MRRVVDDALVAVAAEVGERADSRHTERLREGGVVVTIDADTETVSRSTRHSPNSARSWTTRGATFDEIAEAVEAIVRTKITHSRTWPP